MEELNKDIDYCNLINKFVDVGKELVGSIDFSISYTKRSHIEKTNVRDFLIESDDYEISYGKISRRNKYRLQILINDINRLYDSDTIIQVEKDLFLKSNENTNVTITNFCIACYLLNTLIFYHNFKLYYKIKELNDKKSFILNYESGPHKLPLDIQLAPTICKTLTTYLYEYAKYPALKYIADYYMLLANKKWVSPFNICKTCGKIIEENSNPKVVNQTHCYNCLIEYEDEKGESPDQKEHKMKYRNAKYAYDFFIKNNSLLDKFYPNDKITTIIKNNSRSTCTKKYHKDLMDAYERLEKEISVINLMEAYKKRNKKR